jgi:tetratricopeptide (TPR) repeat protein
MEFKKSRNCAEVLVLLDKAIAIKPDFGEALLEKGWCLNELNRPHEAVPVLNKASAILKNNYHVFYELAHAWYYLDNTDSALSYFRGTLLLNPDHHLSNVGMGDLYREKLNNTKEALNWYLKASKIDSAHKKTNYWIGWCNNDLGNYEKAVYYLQKVVEADSSNVLAAIELGFAFYSLNRYRDAIDAFKSTLALKPRPELAIFYTGICLAKTGNKSDALNKYNELVIMNSTYAVNLLTEIQKMK